MLTLAVRFLLKLYQKTKVGLSPCRFYPSCSVYADQAVGEFGLFRGSYLALKRLIRCNQLFPGGYDPVPANVSRGTIGHFDTHSVAE